MKVNKKLSKEFKKNVLKGVKVPKRLKNVASNAKGKVLLTKSKENVSSSLVAKSTSENQPNEEVQNNLLQIQPETVEKITKALLDLHKDYQKNTKTLPLNNKDFVFLQIVLIKKPEVPEKRRKYLKLYHGLFGEDPEVCLFVSDWKIHDHAKRTPDEKIQVSIDHYEEFLKKQKIDDITTIMPVYQFKTEYGSYEMQKKLVNRFDLFLCQANLMESGSFLKRLGIAFNKKNKLPLVVKFPRDPKVADEKFRNKVNELINSTWYELKPHSDTLSLRVGAADNSVEQLKENIVKVLDQLLTVHGGLPGGPENVKSLMLKTSRSKALPLYINLASPNSVGVPSVPSLRPVLPSVEGELSTQPGKKVHVLSNGDVFVINDSDDDYVSSSDDDDYGRVAIDGVKGHFQSADQEIPPVDQIFDSDDEEAGVERQYLSCWKDQKKNAGKRKRAKDDTSQNAKQAKKQKGNKKSIADSMTTTKAPSPAKTKKAPGPVKTHKAPVPAKTKRATGPGKTTKAPVPAKEQKTPVAAKTKKASGPSKTTKAPVPAKTQKANSPAKTKKTSGPSKTTKAPVPAKTQKANSPAAKAQQTKKPKPGQSKQRGKKSA